MNWCLTENEDFNLSVLDVVVNCCVSAPVMNSVCAVDTDITAESHVFESMICWFVWICNVQFPNFVIVCADSNAVVCVCCVKECLGTVDRVDGITAFNCLDIPLQSLVNLTCDGVVFNSNCHCRWC